MSVVSPNANVKSSQRKFDEKVLNLNGEVQMKVKTSQILLTAKYLFISSKSAHYVATYTTSRHHTFRVLPKYDTKLPYLPRLWEQLRTRFPTDIDENYSCVHHVIFEKTIKNVNISLFETGLFFPATVWLFLTALLFCIAFRREFDTTLVSWLVERMQCGPLRKLCFQILWSIRLIILWIFGFCPLLFSIHSFLLSSRTKESDSRKRRLESGNAAAKVWVSNFWTCFSF